jgi:hypothetical protein
MGSTSWGPLLVHRALKLNILVAKGVSTNFFWIVLKKSQTPDSREKLSMYAKGSSDPEVISQPQVDLEER